MFKLKELRTERKINQQKLADDIGVSRSTIAMWETDGSQPSNEMLLKLSEYFGVTVDFLLENNSENTKKGIKIPVLGIVQAGIPIEAIENIIDYEEINEEMAMRGEYFGLKIKGNSMEPKFSEGDVIIVRKQPDIESGDIAVVLVNGDSATVKKVYKEENGISLVSTNPEYKPMFYTVNQIEELPVKILGKVVELRAKF